MDKERQAAMRLNWLVVFLVFILTLLLSLWRNDFPACYHPDEPEKVAQVLNGERNFHHPPLMLDAAAFVLHLVNGDHGSDHIVRVGRWLSAFYMAAACAIFSWLADLYGGTLAAIFAAVLLALNKQAVLAGHFFKEDPLLAFGLALVFITGAYRWRNRSSWFSLIILGAAAGLATATKYLGIVTLIYAVVLELAIGRTNRTTPHFVWRLLILLIAFALAFLLSVTSAWNHFPAMLRAVTEAGQTAHIGNEGVGAKVPQAQYVGMLFLEPPLALVGLAVGTWSLVRKARPTVEYADCWLLWCAPIVLLLLFSFSAITAVRYFLPISLLVACLSGCGLAIVTQSVRDWAWRRWTLRPSVTTCSAIGFCVLAQLPALLSLERGFTVDDHRALYSFIRTDLPANSVIAADQLACLDAAPALPQRVLTRWTIADLGDFAALRAQGVTHIVVCWYNSRRYITPGKYPATGTESDFLRRREFYLRLKNRARLLWQSEIAQPFPLRPGLSLYELPVAGVP